jgi:predicted acylesterase/phospholipase RssA
MIPVATEALVLSGAGANGGWQAGALASLHTSGYRPEVIAGVSAGALNAVGYVLHGPSWLVERWRTLRTRDVTTTHGVARMAWRVARGRLSLQEHRGLRRIVDEAVTGPLPDGAPIVYAGMVDWSSGYYRRAGLNALDREDLVDAVIASATIPLQWPPSTFQGRRYVDGGLRRMVPLGDVLHHLPGRVTTISTQAPQEQHQESGSIADMARGSLQILLDQVADQNIEAFQRVNELVKATGGSARSASGRPFRYYEHRLIRPVASVGPSLDWDAPSQEARIAAGWEAGQAVLGREVAA